jgi:thiazole synthase
LNSEAPFCLGGETFSSRLLLGTGKFLDHESMIAALKASGCEMVTFALRRADPDSPSNDLLAALRELPGIRLVPNTSGARTAREAILAAQLGRELSGSHFVKVEIHPNPNHLLPDPIETFEACRELVREGFVVMPYMPADPVLAKRLEEVGVACVMPLGAAIGSGQGLQTLPQLRWILRDSTVPVIVDAGLRAPSDAAAALECGCAAVLVNSAIAAAGDPVTMADAFRAAVVAGRAAWRAGLMGVSSEAVATSPLTTFLDEQ